MTDSSTSCESFDHDAGISIHKFMSKDETVRSQKQELAKQKVPKRSESQITESQQSPGQEQFVITPPLKQKGGSSQRA